MKVKFAYLTWVSTEYLFNDDLLLKFLNFVTMYYVASVKKKYSTM